MLLLCSGEIYSLFFPSSSRAPTNFEMIFKHVERQYFFYRVYIYIYRWIENISRNFKFIVYNEV